jgi:exosortase
MNKTIHPPKKKSNHEGGKTTSPITSNMSSASTPGLGSWPIFTGLLAIVATVWAYWPTLTEMIHKWNTMPDYSHGYLVLPLALLFLWSRRDSFPYDQVSPSVLGLLVLAVAVGLRVLAGRYYLQPLDGWTLPLTVFGVVWLLYGTAVMKWSWPAIVFLWFMIPIPYSAELWLRVPLQAIATKLGTAALIMLGQPALAEGNVIYLGDHKLFVEEACSGMRIFIGIFALAFAFVLFSKWSWWQKGLVLIATLPVAIIANVMRIVVTGLLYQHVSTDAGQKFSHDVAGFVMIPLAAGLLWLFLVYLDRLFPRVQEVRVPATLWSTSQGEP